MRTGPTLPKGGAFLSETDTHLAHVWCQTTTFHEIMHHMHNVVMQFTPLIFHLQTVISCLVLPFSMPACFLSIIRCP